MHRLQSTDITSFNAYNGASAHPEWGIPYTPTAGNVDVNRRRASSMAPVVPRAAEAAPP
jgi:hypothetical protein